MPQNRSSAPPPVMTWKKASPVLAVAVFFDLARAFFNMFWFFGPALAAALCTSTASGWVGSVWGLTALMCTAAAGVAGAAVSAITVPFGVVMAMMVGFAGWLTIGFWLLATNGRIFSENAGNGAWFAASLLAGEVPLVNTLPALTGLVWKMYRTQIQKDAQALRVYEASRAAAQAQERQQAMLRIQQAQSIQMQEQEAANEEIPEEMREAA